MKRLFSYIILLFISNGIFSQTWNNLTGGIDSPVHVIIEYNGDLYAGGVFSTAGGVAASNMAKWNGKIWSPVGTGTDGDVNAFYVFNNKLYIGGNFINAGGISAKYIASWDGTTWGTLSTGFNAQVNSLAVYQNKLIAGGDFTLGSGNSANYVSLFSGTAWTALGSGMSGPVNSVSSDNTTLLAGGGFIEGLMQWSGVSWSVVGAFPAGNSVEVIVNDISKYYIGGSFAFSTSRNNITLWDWSNFQPMGNGVNGTVRAIKKDALTNVY